MVNGVVEKQLINPLTRAHFGIFELKQLKQQKIPFGIDPTQRYGYQSLLHCTTADTYRLNQLSEEQALIIETSEETPAFTQERQQNRQHQHHLKYLH